ncbi:tRNA lysidine(34) synthetase TilS [Ottowia sp. GY511]|uniref:tRNA(Ile)-lysidine synthase n=1 Tax=Ottowia flava TaxID=2675430 RepID=A0ABW4KPX3_9BURK|nr:tRNA lysidine(34) synthetase TilS [Ottowia sp. GY511]TXK24740.1 tRNA lysidine(34) synthetase TilS [Ottowia sp. GY511]
MDAFAASAPGLPLAVGFSGGADSTALLLACAARWPGRVRAWHVHHGLQAAADGFETQARAVCDRLGVPLQVAHVDARAQPGESPEAAARHHRYKAFEALALQQSAQAAIKTIVLGQHADDQVETVLIALSRGSGLPGLAGMPARWQRGGLTFCRPLLAVPGSALRAWLRLHGADWVEDPSNADTAYTRNRVRHRLLPALAAVFPEFRTTFARSAQHAAQAQALLDEVAAADLAACGVPPRIAALQALSPARQGNALRHWLTHAHHSVPSAAQLAALQVQIAACRTRGHRIELKVGSGQVRRQGECLAWQAGRSGAAG